MDYFINNVSDGDDARNNLKGKEKIHVRRKRAMEKECEGVRVSRDCVRPSRNNKSSVYNHLVSSTDCCRTYSDSCFSVLCRARHGYLLQLQVLEAVCQRIHKPNLCVQKDSVITLKLFK